MYIDDNIMIHYCYNSLLVAHCSLLMLFPLNFQFLFKGYFSLILHINLFNSSEDILQFACNVHAVFKHRRVNLNLPVFSNLYLYLPVHSLSLYSLPLYGGGVGWGLRGCYHPFSVITISPASSVSCAISKSRGRLSFMDSYAYNCFIRSLISRAGREMPPISKLLFSFTLLTVTTSPSLSTSIFSFVLLTV